MSMDGSTAAFAADISLEAPWELVEAFARQMREMPEDTNRGAEMIAERLRAHGLPAALLRLPLYASNPIRAEVRAGGATYRAKPPAFALSAPEGVTAPSLYLPAASAPVGSERMPTRYDPALVGGRIVVTEGMALPYVVGDLEAAGAAGVVTVNPGRNIHWGTVSTIWGTPGIEDLARLPKIATCAVNQPDGLALIAQAQQGAPLTLVTELRTGWYDALMPTVTIPGAVEPERFVLLHGHYDSWQYGVGDNATGNACMLEVARVLWRNRHALRRSVRLVWWAGHSTARYGGSTWYADQFALDLAENCVVHMNCDSPGCRDATTYPAISLTPECEAAVQDVVRAVTGQETKGKRPARNSDYAFHNIGISACFMASSMMPPEKLSAQGYHVGGCGGNIAWHTEDDTLEIADRAVLRTDIAVYLAAVLRFANAPRLPVDFRAAASGIGATLEGYARQAGSAFDLGPALAAQRDLAAALEAFHAASVPDDRANAVLLKLARILGPIDFTRGPRFTHDAAVNAPAVPTLSLCAEIAAMSPHDQGFARASLTRARNRVEAALREATALVRAALA
jgi:Zn-dependent M28 family amino/carboxypeptidase